MRILPKFYYDKSIIQVIDNLILDGYKSYNSIDEHDKEIIAAKCINLLGDDAYTCLIDSPNLSKMLNLFKNYLLSSNQDSSYDLLEVMRKNATEYFADDLTDLFSERYDGIQSDINWEKGLRPSKDAINGEITWRHSA